MRYSVKPAGLLRCCEELEGAVRRLRRESEALEDTIRRLKQMSYMETVCVQLRREQEKLDERIRLTLTMAQAVRRCRDAYRSTEQQIMDEVDCPRHVLTEYGAGAAGQTYAQSAQADAAGVQTAHQFQPAPSAALDWGMEIGAYAEVFNQAGIDVRLED